MNIKENLASIGQNILLGVLFLGIIFILVGLKSTETNWLFIGIGIVIIFPYIISFFWLNKKSSAFHKQQEKEFQKLLKTGDRVHVVLEDAKIIEKNHTETNTVKQDYRAAAINEITGNGHHNEERITYTYCEVTFKVNYKGQKLIIEEVIHKDEASVRMHFYMQKVTTFYINPNNMNEIYLDLSFINN